MELRRVLYRSGNPESALASTTLDTDATEHVTLTVAPVINAAAASNAAFTLAGLDDSVTGTGTFHDGVNPDVVVAVTRNATYHANLTSLSDGPISATLAATARFRSRWTRMRPSM